MIDVSAVVGIDVSKASLDVACWIDQPVRTFPNGARGHRDIACLLERLKPRRVVLEATGGYERRKVLGR